MPSLVKLAVRLNQFMALPFELVGHSVERPAQKAEFVRIRAFIDPRRKIAGPDPFGGSRKVGYRPRQPVRKHQSDPNRDKQQQ